MRLTKQGSIGRANQTFVATQFDRVGSFPGLREAQRLAVRDEVRHILHTTEPTRLLQQLTAEALAEGRELEGLSVRRPTLEDVYLSLTAAHEE